MIYRKRLLVISFITILTALLIACNQTTTTERTTDMTSNLVTTTTEEPTTTTEPTTSPTTTTEVSVVLSDAVMVNDIAYVNQMLEFDVFETGENKKINVELNPYDYEEIKIVFDFTSPSEKSLTQTAFWYKSYESIRLIGSEVDEDGFYTAGQEYIDWGDTESNYRVRINPDEAGEWDYTARLIIRGDVKQTLSGSFTVNEATESKGYIDVDQVNNRNFIFRNSQETYIPMGSNFAWFSGLGTHDYHNWFKHMNEQNGNFARIWLSNWSLSIHKFSYTNFDSRQNILARIDLLMDFAKQYDVYIMLTLINHGQFSYSTNPEWAENPYNEENGGMLEYPIQFFYNEEARRHYKNELMYLISRYGYSENIFAWELFNEVDWVDGYSHLVVSRWHDEMAQFIKNNDPYQHMVSTSYKYTFGTPAFDYESLDFTNFHSYAYTDQMFYQKFVSEMTSLWDKYQKPVFFGEIGIDWQSGGGTYNLDYSGITIHQGLWSGMMTSAGGANQWWWDSWIERNDLWYRYKGASTYATYIDVANKHYTLLAEATDITIQGEDIGIMGYRLEDALYGYIYNNNYNYWRSNPDTVENVSVTIPFANGEYELMIFDTVTGEIIETQTVVIEDRTFVLSGLSIKTDYAFILR